MNFKLCNPWSIGNFLQISPILRIMALCIYYFDGTFSKHENVRLNHCKIETSLILYANKALRDPGKPLSTLY